MRWDSVAMVDWASGKDTGRLPRKDAIWLGAVLGGVEAEPEYLRNRQVAEARIADLIVAERTAGRRLLIGFDFPFGYPKGFAKAVVGRPDPLALWDWFAANLKDGPEGNDRFALAGRLNALFPGVGPFWFDGTGTGVEGLPHKGTERRDHALPERREAELHAAGAFTLWQMGGAGAVGGQAMTGMASLSRLRAQFPDDIAVWPFEPLDRPVAFVEVWPSLLGKALTFEGSEIRDRAQVRHLARAVSRLSEDVLSEMLDVQAPEEGWILGIGHEQKLRDALPKASSLKPPPLRDDCFALPPGVDWTPVDEALDRLRARLHPVVGVEVRPLDASEGRVLARSAVARRANPPAANSAVDGYGFAHRALGPGDVTLPLVEGRAAAGAPYDGRLPEGRAIRILTGALLPPGVDTVVLEEDTATDGQQVAFRGKVKPGANTRRAGEDVDQGGEMLASGARLGPPELALLAATGVTEVEVYRPLRVGVLSTGSEIVASGGTPDPARTYDANRPMLLALLRDWRIEAVDLGHVPDDRDRLRTALDAGAQTADAILTSGGASAGDEDHVSALLGETGTRADWRIALKPGRPLALGMWKGVPVFGLPGNPVAALVCTLIFARPAFALMGGEGWRIPQGFSVPAAFSKRKKPGRREYLRARMTPDGSRRGVQERGVRSHLGTCLGRRVGRDRRRRTGDRAGQSGPVYSLHVVQIACVHVQTSVSDAIGRRRV